MTTRWLFAEQLGPHFQDSPDQRVLLVESTRTFARRPVHRRKAHLVLSALRHRAAELGDRAWYVKAATYAGAVREMLPQTGPLSVCDPTSYRARRFVRQLAADGVPLDVLPARGFAATEEEFRRWADGRGAKRLLMEDFYREQRRRLGLLLDGDGPVGGRWNYDDQNRESPPKGATALDLDEPWWPTEDAIDAGVREDLDRMERDHGARFVGEDGPRRFAVSRAEALECLDRFLTRRLAAFGTYEDAMLRGDPWMSHSLLSAPLNLGLLDPVEVARAAEDHGRAHGTRLASVEGFVRQVVGWRDYVWHLYWYLGEDYRDRNALDAGADLPQWFWNLDADREVGAACLSSALGSVREHGWTHHIPRLMLLGNWALQQGYRPAEVTEWFRSRFVDGYDWVMTANVVGMSQHADGGVMATKPYVAGGAYINRMSDYCGGCRYDPKKRTGPDACPFTAGYWAFLDRNAAALQDNPRMRQPLVGLGRRDDIGLIRATADRGEEPP